MAYVRRVRAIWQCDDEEEALGLELVLTRAGIPVVVQYAQGEQLVLETEDEFAARAEALLAQVARHYVRGVEHEQVAALDRRDRLARRSIWAIVSVSAVVALLAICG